MEQILFWCQCFELHVHYMKHRLYRNLILYSCSLPPSPPPPPSPGSGWTTKETVRSLAYSILADLVHHIRTSLSLQHLSMAVFLFSKNVHDETLPVSIQTMSCKLLLNLVECIRLKAENEPSVSVNWLYTYICCLSFYRIRENFCWKTIIFFLLTITALYWRIRDHFTISHVDTCTVFMQENSTIHNVS